MTESFSQLLAESVQQHRKVAGLSQHELAKLAGVGKTVIFDIEHAKETVKILTMIRVLKIEMHSPLMNYGEES